MLKNSWRNWLSERYMSIKAEEAFQEEMETTVAVLTKEKKALEQSFSAYHFANATFDYEGIEKLHFQGDYVQITTKGEQYTVKLQNDEEIFQFLKNLNFPQSYHTLVGRERWIITTQVSDLVDRRNLPELDYLYLEEQEETSRMYLDLSEEIDLLYIKDIVDTLCGEFSVRMNGERIHKALTDLANMFTVWFDIPFSIKLNVTNVRHFTLYAQNDEGVSVDIAEVGYFDIEQVLLDQNRFYEQLKKKIHPLLPSIEQRLAFETNEQKKKQALVHVQETVNQISPLLMKVNYTSDENRPLISFNTLKDPVTLHCFATSTQTDMLQNMNALKVLLQKEANEVQQFINSFTIRLEATQPYSLEEGYIHASASKEMMNAFLQEATNQYYSLSVERLQTWIGQEHPSIQKVLKRFRFTTHPMEANYSFSDQFINVFISEQNYQQLTKKIRKLIYWLSYYEFTDTYQSIHHDFIPSLFGIVISEYETRTNYGYVKIVLIEKEGEKPFKKYFKDGMLIPTTKIKLFEI